MLSAGKQLHWEALRGLEEADEDDDDDGASSLTPEERAMI